MITLFIWVLTVLLVLTSLFLILLVLVQLPKKEAGSGLAFGAGTADALLGAGSGNALTKVTKYTVIAFFLVSITLSVAYNHQRRATKPGLAGTLANAPLAGAPAAPAPTTPKASGLIPSATNILQTPIPAATNRPAGTNK